MNYIIPKILVKAWLRKLIKHGILVAPTELKGGDVVFKEAFTPDNILLEFGQPVYSAKSFFLPQEETLFKFVNRSAASVEEVFDQFPRIFFGLRPCDTKAIIQADRFFGEDYRDPFYSKRRENTLLIAVGCNNPEDHCFCHLMGSGPMEGEGADLFMVDLGKDFAVTARTAKGRKAVSNSMYFFEKPAKQHENLLSQLKAEAENKLQNNFAQVDITSYYQKLDDTFLNKISTKCFSCGSCSYICPMCFCYNVVDRENRNREGQRLRTWDSCIFEGFTRMAGRHNLLKSRQERLKKRFAHKLEQYPEKYGIPGCTGCGRCSATCLGKIGMFDILKQLTREVSPDVQK